MVSTLIDLGMGPQAVRPAALGSPVGAERLSEEFLLGVYSYSLSTAEPLVDEPTTVGRVRFPSHQRRLPPNRVRWGVSVLHECRQAWNIGAPCSDALSRERAPWGGRKHLEVNRSFSGAAGAALGPGSSQSQCELSKDALALASVRSLSSEGFRRQGVNHHLSCLSLVLPRIRLRALLVRRLAQARPELRYAALRCAASPPFGIYARTVHPSRAIGGRGERASLDLCCPGAIVCARHGDVGGLCGSCVRSRAWVPEHWLCGGCRPWVGSFTNLVDPASSHMLVSKIKPCMSQYKLLYGETANGSLKQL